MQRFAPRTIAALSIVFLALPLHAQQWPSKPVTIIVPSDPGGGNDIMARLFAANTRARLGQPVIVENRAGAGGNIGAAYVAKQPADGHTLMINSAGYIINEHLYRNMPFDPVKDFDAVSLISKSPFVLTVPGSSPAKTARELIALAQSKPQGLNFGSAGVGTPLHLAGEMIRTMTNANMTHIPYKGSGGLGKALLSGEVDFGVLGITSTAGLIKAGKLRALALMNTSRVDSLPGLPTVAEALGVPGLALDTWIGALAPAGTPRPVVNRLSSELNRFINDPQVVKENLAPSSIEPVGSTPEQFAEVIRSDAEKFRRIARAAGLKPQ